MSFTIKNSFGKFYFMNANYNGNGRRSDPVPAWNTELIEDEEEVTPKKPGLIDRFKNAFKTVVGEAAQGFERGKNRENFPQVSEDQREQSRNIVTEKSKKKGILGKVGSWFSKNKVGTAIGAGLGFAGGGILGGLYFGSIGAGLEWSGKNLIKEYKKSREEEYEEYYDEDDLVEESIPIIELESDQNQERPPRRQRRERNRSTDIKNIPSPVAEQIAENIAQVLSNSEALGKFKSLDQSRRIAYVTPSVDFALSLYQIETDHSNTQTIVDYVINVLTYEPASTNLFRDIKEAVLSAIDTIKNNNDIIEEIPTRNVGGTRLFSNDEEEYNHKPTIFDETFDETDGESYNQPIEYSTPSNGTTINVPLEVVPPVRPEWATDNFEISNGIDQNEFNTQHTPEPISIPKQPNQPNQPSIGSLSLAPNLYQALGAGYGLNTENFKFKETQISGLDFCLQSMVAIKNLKSQIEKIVGISDVTQMTKSIQEIRFKINGMLQSIDDTQMNQEEKSVLRAFFSVKKNLMWDNPEITENDKITLSFNKLDSFLETIQSITGFSNSVNLLSGKMTNDLIRDKIVINSIDPDSADRLVVYETLLSSYLSNYGLQSKTNDFRTLITDNMSSSYTEYYNRKLSQFQQTAKEKVKDLNNMTQKEKNEIDKLSQEITADINTWVTQELKPITYQFLNQSLS